MKYKDESLIYLRDLLQESKIDFKIQTEDEKRILECLNLAADNSSSHIENVEAINTLLRCCVKDNNKIDTSLLEKVHMLLKKNLYDNRSEIFKDIELRISIINDIDFFNFLYQLHTTREFSRKHDEKIIEENREILEKIMMSFVSQLFTESESISSSSKKDNTESQKTTNSISYVEAFDMLRFLDISNKLLDIQLKRPTYTTSIDIEFAYKNLFKQLYASNSKKLKEYLTTFESDKKFSTNFAGTLIGATLSCTTLSTCFNEPFIKQVLTVILTTALVDASQNVLFKTLPKLKDKLKEIQKDKENFKNSSEFITPLRVQYKLKERQLFENLAANLQKNDKLHAELSELLSGARELHTVTEGELKKFKNIHKLFVELHRDLLKLRKDLYEKEQEDALSNVTYSLTPLERDELFEVLRAFSSFDDENRDKLRKLYQSKDPIFEEVEKVVESHIALKRSLSTIKSFDELIRLIQRNSAKEFLKCSLNEAEELSNFQRFHQKRNVVHSTT